MMAVLFMAACGGGEQEPSPVPPAVDSTSASAGAGPSMTQEKLGALLDLEDMRGLLNVGGEVETRIIDFKSMAEAADPTQVEDMESWHGQNFAPPDISRGLTFHIMDLTTDAAARAHFDTVLSTTPGLQTVESAMGDASAEVEANADRSGSVLIFLKADLLVGFHTSHPENGTPFMSLDGLRQLAEVVNGRLP